MLAFHWGWHKSLVLAQDVTNKSSTLGEDVGQCSREGGRMEVFGVREEGVEGFLGMDEWGV